MDNAIAAEEPVYDASAESKEVHVRGLSEAEVVSAEVSEDVSVRSDFSTSIAFEPFLRSDASGDVSMNFTTSDKLSTFVVQVFAHDKQMHNAVARREMVVTILTLPTRMWTAG